MVDNTWVLDLEDIVFTKVKGITYAKLNKKIPNIYYTTTDSVNENVTHPHTVYLHEMQSVEVGRTLEGDSINGVVTTFEVKVIVNTEKVQCKTILKEIINAFKQLKFEVVGVPIIKADGMMFVGIGRFRITLGQGNTL